MPSQSMTSLARAVLRLPAAPERALEVECGDGEGALFLAREYPAARLRGCDRSEDEIRRAAARVGLDPEGRVAFKHASGALPYPDDHFDLVVQRRGRPRPRELARVLRPGGHLILIHVQGPLLAGRLRRRGLIPLDAADQASDDAYIARLDI